MEAFDQSATHLACLTPLSPASGEHGCGGAGVRGQELPGSAGCLRSPRVQTPSPLTPLPRNGERGTDPGSGFGPGLLVRRASRVVPPGRWHRFPPGEDPAVVEERALGRRALVRRDQVGQLAANLTPD